MNRIDQNHSPQLGRREKDMRQKFADVGSSVQNENKSKVDASQGAARAISSFIDPGLSWKDIPWFKSITNMPIVLKGVQTWEDAVLAAEAGLAGIVLSVRIRFLSHLCSCFAD